MNETVRLEVEKLAELAAWLGFDASLQDLAKAAVLAAFVLVILVILGDVYRGEIQNTFHRVRVISHRTKDPLVRGTLREALQVPKYMVGPTLDNVFTNGLFYYRYRDHVGRIRTKFLKVYRFKLNIRKAYPESSAQGTETLHKYSDDELSSLEKERPDTDSGRPVSEIVSVASSRADYLNELMKSRVARADTKYSILSRSRVRRWLSGIKESDLREPELLGLVMKFHFPVNPYFLLYRHPDTNVRSTAWLTVLTSVFALFMQLVYGTSPSTTTKPTSVQTAEIVQPISIKH